MPLLDKLSYRTMLSDKRKVWDDQDKERKTQQCKVVAEQVSRLCERVAAPAFIAQSFDVGTNTKVHVLARTLYIYPDVARVAH